DGLAKSSRNTYLNEEERAAATVLRRSILEGKKAIDSGNLSKEEVLKIIKGVIEKERLARIDYVEIIDFDTFDQVETIKDNTLIAMAVYIGKTRLIDNLVINL
ncbi:MAG: pantoate--beta-alanine ligase, partial [Peptostreptococcus stomatis]